ncbi:hypothetical protein D9757_009506 [Collybiopsis confluens]|uniref:Uncharacterized protein n=1 Tax=Collybiopsis confluens TaxID=2823264 RepID=A0A8H5H8I1_9AGAR|nr:hypothetical protein D9757_009506 [Collybiopsis confluens]
MRFFSALLPVFTLAASSVVAQHAFILAPADQTQVAAGSGFDVSIAQPNSISSWENIALVIGLLNCAAQLDSDGNCLGTNQGLGTILYNGPFNPVLVQGAPPNQNFTLTVPTGFQKGASQLGVALFDLIGARFIPSLQTFNTTIIVT